MLRTFAVLLCALVAACAAPAKSTLRQYHYPTGELMAEMEEVNHLPNGLGRRFHPNGKLAYEGQYVAGDKYGTFHHFSANGVWVKQEFYRRGKLLWTSTDRNDQPPARIVAEPKTARQPLFLEEGVKAPFFLGMRPLVLRDGIAIKGSYQNVSKDERDSRGHNIGVSAAHDLSVIGLPSVSAYGATGLALLQRGSRDGGTLLGKRGVELGGRWRAKERNLSVSLGALLPLVGDNLEGYRAEVVGGQLGMDSLLGYPRTSSLRSHATYIRQVGPLWLRGDAGVDLVINTDGNDQLQTESSSAIVTRLGGSVGVATRRFFLASQVRSAMSTGGLDTMVNASLSAEVRQYQVRPGLIVCVPLTGEQTSPGIALSLTYALD